MFTTRLTADAGAGAAGADTRAAVGSTGRPAPLVAVRDLTKAYDGRIVVDGLSFEVAQGDIVGLIGANGAGKTTTVEIVQGLRRADSGTVRVLGLDPVRDAATLRPQLGSQLQSSALPDQLRVDEAVRLFTGPDADDPDELLERFGLGHRRRYKFKAMSGGEQQRLFLVLALLNRPRLVILDELTQGLDPAARQDVWASVRKLHAAGTTVLLVTHELDEVEALCTTVIAMRDGTVLDAGRPDALIERHTRGVTIRFTPPEAGLADALLQLNGLPGVTSVRRNQGQVELTGDRGLMVELGAWLHRRGERPADLAVRMPTLEDALISLLGPTGSGPVAEHQPDQH